MICLISQTYLNVKGMSIKKIFGAELCFDFVAMIKEKLHYINIHCRCILNNPELR